MELEGCGLEGLWTGNDAWDVTRHVEPAVSQHTLICTAEDLISSLGAHSEEIWLLKDKRLIKT